MKKILLTIWFRDDKSRREVSGVYSQEEAIDRSERAAWLPGFIGWFMEPANG